MGGSTGNDTIYGDGDADRLFGESDNDTLDGDGGNDTGDQAPDGVDALPAVSWTSAMKAGAVAGDRSRTHATTTAETELNWAGGVVLAALAVRSSA